MELRADAVRDVEGLAWTLVRCPRCREVLGEVAGRDARLRKVCDRCRPRQPVVYDHRTGRCTLEPVTTTAHTVPTTTATAVAG